MKKLSTGVSFIFLGLVLAVGPFAIYFLGKLLALVLGCSVQGYTMDVPGIAHGCMLFGADIGDFLIFLSGSAFLTIIGVPLGGLLFVIGLITSLFSRKNKGQ